MSKLYEYKGVLWKYVQGNFGPYVIPICPIHKMELNCSEYSGTCEDCKKRYTWNEEQKNITDFLRRKINSEVYQKAEIMSIDGIQTPQLKTRVKIPNENEEYWIEARLNKSDKGRQIVLYVGQKDRPGKVQLFANLDQEKLSFDHKDRKPEDIFTVITATFPTGKEMVIKAPEKKK